MIASNWFPRIRKKQKFHPDQVNAWILAINWLIVAIATPLPGRRLWPVGAEKIILNFHGFSGVSEAIPQLRITTADLFESTALDGIRRFIGQRAFFSGFEQMSS